MRGVWWEERGGESLVCAALRQMQARDPSFPSALPSAPSADRLQVDEPVTTVPTIGFNVETLQYKNIKFQVWDLGGQSSIRPYWRCYYPNTDAIIFVVDCADRERVDTARAELHAMLEEEDLKDAILLLFANKQDMKGA